MTEQPDGCPLRILLVEDDPGDQELARRALEDSGIRGELSVVGDGATALDSLLRQAGHVCPSESHRPDLILLDLNLPRLDGREVLAQLSSHQELRRIPVVALTISRDSNDIQRAYTLGARSYVVKPSDPEQFVQALQHVVAYWCMAGQRTGRA